MKRHLVAIFGSVVLAGSLVAAQDPSAPVPPAREPAFQPQEKSGETTLTGCLVQGSGPTVFILDNAKTASEAKSAKGQSYVLEISAPPDKIKSVLNHQVTIVGAADPASAAAPPAASNQKRNESDLPKLTATRITPTSQTCSATGD